MTKKTSKRVSKNGTRSKKERANPPQTKVRPRVMAAYRDSDERFSELYSKLSQKD